MVKSKAPQGFLGFAGLYGIVCWWAHQDSNLEPTGYEPATLTN